MARRKAGKENVRSLSKVSNGTSYAITLPIAVVKRFGWKERQKLELTIHERAKTITIRDWSALASSRHDGKE
jgi:bifunctional DNA-binding transcriptional regulator/antitoxin component of YhaV-PrlF toxin-antitoxin module